MIFVEGYNVIDTGKLPSKPKKESWTDGERFRMIFTKEMKEVQKVEKDNRRNYKRTAICSNRDGAVYRYEDRRSG